MRKDVTLVAGAFVVALASLVLLVGAIVELAGAVWALPALLLVLLLMALAYFALSYIGLDQDHRHQH